MRSLLSLGRARGAAARIVDGRGGRVAGLTSLPVRGRSWGSLAAVALILALGALLVASASALAAPLEAPELIVESASPNYTTLHGVLNPLKASEAGTYEFIYKQGKAGCTGGTKVPVPPGLMTGAEHEEVYEYLYGLAQGTEYTACLRAVNTTSSPSEEATSAPVTFTTSIPPETPTVVSPVKSLSARSATLEGLLNPAAAGDPGSYEFRYSASATGCGGGEVSGGSALGAKDEAVKAVVALQPNTTYTFCLVATNDVGEQSAASSLVTFSTPLAAPVVESETFTGVDATEARLNATVNPSNSETAYHFEYGPAAGSYNVSVPGGEIHAGTAGVGVSAALTGLTPDTTYHYRVVVSNGLPGSVDGPDGVFTTSSVQGTGSSSPCPNEQLRAEQPYALELPDCRAYEMASPLETGGSDAVDSFIEVSTRASVSGEAVTYGSEGAFAEPTGTTEENQYISRRGPEGWSTQAITPLHDPNKGETNASYPTADFTPELTEGVANTNASLTSEAPAENENLYVYDLGSRSYRYVGPGIKPAGSSIDLSHVVAQGGYEWVNGKTIPFEITNAGVPMSASIGAMYYFSEREDLWHAVSSDGSRVYFTAQESLAEVGVGGLYVRVNAERPQSPMVGEQCTSSTDACTIEVSASQRATLDPHGPQPARYWGASADGSKVFFTSSAELTDDAYTGPTDDAANLYEYDLERPENERLKDLTVDKTDADGASVQGVVQISEEGSYVYFVAEGALAGKAVAGEPNLYVSHEGSAPTFIATLGVGDSSDWHAGYYEGESGPEINTAVVTPSGSRLAFISEESLTGYDNRQAEPGECETSLDYGGFSGESGQCREIFYYDAETMTLVCASCNPSGARPVGPSSFTSITSRGEPADGTYRVRNMIENGTLFFESADALVPHASDGRINVYEYEDGQVYPISNVAGGYGSFFLDASANGDNVFFGSADQLLPQDKTNTVVVYDARVGGGYPVTVAPPSCDNGDSCKPPQAPQPGIFGAPGSASFSGPGNVEPTAVVKPAVKAKAKPTKCKKGYVRSKGKCVKHRAAKKKAKKSSDRKGSK